MDCYVRLDSWDKRFKGFPVYSDKARSSAQNWAGPEGFVIQIPDTLVNCGIDGYDDRMNNKVFKVFYFTKIRGQVQKLYFDMYAEPLVDLLMQGTVDNGIIKTPITFIDRGRLVIEKGALHKEYLQKQQQKAVNKLLKKIPTKNIILGGVYRKTPGSSNMYLYLGKHGDLFYEAQVDEYVLKKYCSSTTSDGRKCRFPVNINDGMKSAPSYKEPVSDMFLEPHQLYDWFMEIVNYYDLTLEDIEGREARYTSDWTRTSLKLQKERAIESKKFYENWAEAFAVYIEK